MARSRATLILLLLQYLLFLAPSPTFALTLPSLKTIPQQLNSSLPPFQTTTGERAVDPRFSTLFNDGTEDLSDKSVYMSVLKALRNWSRHDLQYPAAVGRYQYAGFKDVEIKIERDDATSSYELTWQRAIWGLYLAVRRLQYSGFLNCRTMLLWDKETIGYIYIQKFDPEQFSSSENSSLSMSGVNLTTENAEMTTTLLISPKVNLAIDVTGRRLSKWAVFFPIYSAIVSLLSLLSSEPISIKMKTHDPDSNTVLNIEPWAEPRTAPPYFMPSTTITALALIPVWMYEKKKFNEVTLVFEVDGKPVGYGYLRQLRLFVLEGTGNGTDGIGAGNDGLITDT